MFFKVYAAVLLAIVLPAFGMAAEFDAQTARDWLDAFAVELSAWETRNDVGATADPARAGEYLYEYDFGTVLSTAPQSPQPSQILMVELKGEHIADCRGLQVGQTLEDVIAGRAVAQSDTPLYVLSTQESGYGWSWVYLSGSDVYGVEYISYAQDGLSVTEYTLTYVIDDERITAIRLKAAPATQAQAKEGLRTAEEIAARQFGRMVLTENDQPEFAQTDMTINGKLAAGVPVEALIAILGEPDDIQNLPGGTGRMLIFDQAVAELVFDVMTGVEFVWSISCAGEALSGPRGLRVGMTLEQAAGLFRCDTSVFSTGGDLYLAGEAQGVAPYGAMLCDDQGLTTLRYACEAGEETGAVDVMIENGRVVSWRLYIMEETEAAYGG